MDSSSSIGVVQLKDLGARCGAFEAKRIGIDDPRAIVVSVLASSASRVTVVGGAVPSVVAKEVIRLVIALSSSIVANIVSASKVIVTPCVHRLVIATVLLRASIGSAIDSIVTDKIVSDMVASSLGRTEVGSAVEIISASFDNGREDASSSIGYASVRGTVDTVVAKSVVLRVAASSVDRANVVSARNIIVAELGVSIVDASLVLNRAISSSALVGLVAPLVVLGVDASAKANVAFIESAINSVVASEGLDVERAVSSVNVAIVGSASDLIVADNLFVVALSVASADIDSARVVVLTSRVIGVDNASKNLVAIEAVAFRVIVASFAVGDVSAVSGQHVAVVDSARDTIVAFDLDSVASSFISRRSVAEPGMARVSVLGTPLVRRDVSASTKVNVARVIGTFETVVAKVVVGSVGDSGFGIALVFSAPDIVREVDFREVASSIGTAEVDSANAVVVAVLRVRNVDALVKILRAIVVSASVFSVIALVVMSFVVASAINALVGSASEIIIAHIAYLGLLNNTSPFVGVLLVRSALVGIARVETFVSVAEIVQRNVLALAKFLVANIVSAVNVIVAMIVNGFVNTSSLLARVVGARNAIVAVHVGVNASVSSDRISMLGVRLASIDGARVRIVTPFVHRDTDASSNWVHTGLFGVAYKLVSAVKEIFAGVEVDSM